MSTFEHKKYKAFSPIPMPHRKWPDRQITQAPLWCSVDLRDGNQALIEPMTPEQKLKLFTLLVEIGFKEIEVGFPAASITDFDFVRYLIDNKMVPEDVTIQVLTPAREDMIARTFESLKGANKVIVHLYNSTSTVQRKQVFKLDKSGVTALAVNAAKTIRRLADKQTETEWTFEYSPESFTGTELDFAVEICDAVAGVWQPTVENPVIINLPATVEMSTPNIFADQIEWFCGHILKRDAILISVHTHNDRGCAVAAAELAVMAGADRVEGTLMGNGERTGNMDVITMAMNLYSQGINPMLDFSAMDKIIRTVQDCTQLPVHARHPYAGELVFTAFSGSHQDAINKCLALRKPEDHWDVAYLPIDPADLGRSYQEVIRINSQSGKGGIAYILAREYGIEMPRWLQIEFSALVQNKAEETESEMSGEMIWSLFQETYLLDKSPEPDITLVPDDRYRLSDYSINRHEGIDRIAVGLEWNKQVISLKGEGNGVIDAFVNAISHNSGVSIVLVDYSEHAINLGSDLGAKSAAMAYVQLNINGERICGVANSEDIVEASLAAIINGLNRSMTFEHLLVA
ncbi:MAG: 2-isopropylmalate synthase [Oceanicoccus sp.]|jgi:2-isopropylmalate synthase